MQIIYHTTFLARSACDYCYYYIYQATWVADGEWRCRPEAATAVLAAPAADCTYTTYWRVSAVMEVMENGEDSHGSQTTLPGMLEGPMT